VKINTDRPSILLMLAFVSVGCILLPTYVLTLLCALPYSVVSKVTNWYTAQGIAWFGTRPTRK